MRRKGQPLPMQMSQEEVDSFEKRLEEEIIASKATGDYLDVSLLPRDEAIIKEMIEADLKRTLFGNESGRFSIES
jgi:hypothetical protein